MFPYATVHSGTVTLAAGEERTLFIDEVGVHEGSRAKLVLKSLRTSRSGNIWLQFYEDQDPYLDRINTNGLPGLDEPLTPLQLTIHSGHELRAVAINEGAAPEPLTYYFYLELLPEDDLFIRQVIWARNPTLEAYERERWLGSIRVAPDQIGVLYGLGLARNTAIRVYIKKDDRHLPPTEGFFCGATLNIDAKTMDVLYLLDGTAGEEKLDVVATSTSDTPQTFPYRILGWIMDTHSAEALTPQITPQIGRLLLSPKAQATTERESET